MRPAEREEISRGVAAGKSIRSIAVVLNRAPSTISRELRRNQGRQRYRAAQADQAAWYRALRPKACKLGLHRVLASQVAAKLRLQWSPEQIAGGLGRMYPDDMSRQGSHETIYRTLYIQSRGALKKELLAHLRRTRAMRRSRHHTQKTENHGRIKDTVSISERPANAKDRAVPSHWEGDLVCGNKDSKTVVNALIKSARRLPKQLYWSLTWDRGSEMARHRHFNLATDIQVYFCDPHKPWQRGSNESTNGLRRQYFPKGMDLSNVSQDKLDARARKLSERLRKTLGYAAPAELDRQIVASIG